MDHFRYDYSRTLVLIFKYFIYFEILRYFIQQCLKVISAQFLKSFSKNTHNNKIILFVKTKIKTSVHQVYCTPSIGTPRNPKEPQVTSSYTPKVFIQTNHTEKVAQSRFLEAPLVRQADDELNKYSPIFQSFFAQRILNPTYSKELYEDSIVYYSS